MDACYKLAGLIEVALPCPSRDLGVVIRGLTLTSNFCPISPVVHSFILYAQNPSDDGHDDYNTHDRNQNL